jgi:hypothetical protein
MMFKQGGGSSSKNNLVLEIPNSLYLAGDGEDFATASWAACTPSFPAVTTVPTVLVPVFTVPTTAPLAVVAVSPAA